MAKQIYIAALNQAGTILKVIQDATFDSFTKTINGGLGTLTFTLAREFDTFNNGGEVSLGNRIEVTIYDEDTGNSGVLIYRGNIEQHIPQISGGNENVRIVCLGVVNRLGADVLKNAAQTKLYTNATTGLGTSAAAAVEIQTVVKAIIDRYNIENASGPINYSTLGGVETVQATGVSMNYIFNAMTYLDALNICRLAAPQNWYFYVDASGILNFKSPPLIATHEFVVGKHVKSIEVQKGLDSVKNIFLLSDGVSVYKQYKDDVSIAAYGRRVQQQTQSNVQDTATLDAIGAAFIAENKDPRVRVELEIVDNNEDIKLGYDIEKINPGDTCKISGITYGTLLTDNMLITQVQYKLTSVILTIETRPEFDLNNFVVKLRKDLQQDDNNALPSSYT